MLAILLLPAVCLCLSAQDFYHGGVSARSAGLAGIYIPDASDAVDALALNPAGLADLAGPSANLSLLGGLAWGSFYNVSNTNSRMRLKPGVIPLGAVGLPLAHGHLSVGAGILEDFVSSVNWHYSDAPGTAGTDYGSQAEKSEILVYRAALGVGYAVSPHVSVGVSAGLVYNENTLRAPYIFQENPQLAGLKTLLDLHTHGWAAGGSFGLVGRPTAKLVWTAAYSSPYAVTSRGHASGNLGAQFQAAGIPFAPDFGYDAKVKVKVPQSVLAGGRWQVAPRAGLDLQGDFANFRSAFNRLPVSLSHGTNQDINGFLNSSSIEDEVPLHWSDQFSLRAAVDLKLGRRASVEGGYTRRSSLVPNGTVTPLTGAILKNAIATGVQRDFDRVQLAGSYSLNLNQSASVGTSGLRAGEYSNSHLTVGTQALVLSVTWRRKTGSRSTL